MFGEGKRQLLKRGHDPLPMAMSKAPSDDQSRWPEEKLTPTAETNFLRSQDAWVTAK